MKEFIELAVAVIREHWHPAVELPSNHSNDKTAPVYEAVLSFETPTIVAIFNTFENEIKVVSQSFESADDLAEYSATKIKNAKFRKLPANNAKYFTYEGNPPAVRKVTPVPGSAMAAGPLVEGLPSKLEMQELIKDQFDALGVKL